MTKTAKRPWETYLEHDCIGAFAGKEGYVYEVKIRVRGGEIFTVVRVSGPFGPRVAFVTAKSFEGVAKGVRDLVSGEGGKWRDDQYA